MLYNDHVDVLVTGEAGSLPDRMSTQQYFSQYGHVDYLEETDEGFLVMLNSTHRLSWIPNMCRSRGSITALHGTPHYVDGHRVEVNLLRPDVYGCEVTVARHRVSVTVGHEVIRRMTQDETYKQFIQALPIDMAMVCFLPNQIEVQLLKTVSQNTLDWEVWEMELCVVQQITTFLEPFKDLLPQTFKHTSYRERYIDNEFSKETPPSEGLNTHDGEAITVFQFTDEGKLRVATSEGSLKQLRQSYPTIDISCDTGMKTLTLRGPARVVYRAKEDMCSLVQSLTQNHVILNQEKMQVLDNLDARKRIQRTLVTNNIVCFWEICEMFGSDDVIKVTASQKDQPRAKQVFESSFQTIKIPFDKNQKSSLQSNAWKLCLERLQTRKEGEPALVVDVGDNDVVIRGLTVSLESSRRAVLEFFHRNVVQTYPQLYGQEVEEVITGLKPWQMKFLMNTDLKERIVAELPDLAVLDVQSDSLVIKAPLRLLTESVSLFWKFFANLSQKQIHLTTAHVQLYKQPAARSKVQTQVQAAGLTCQWEVEDDHITVGADDAAQERLKQIFTSAFSEVHVPVVPGKSHLLRSDDFQALVTELQERKTGSSTPVVQTSSGDNCVIIVDESESCAAVQRAIKTFFENHDVFTSASQKETQTHSPQHENFAAQTEVKKRQTEERHQQTEEKNFRSTEQQTDNRQLDSKEQQTQDNSVITVEKEQRTERPMLTENGFRTDKRITQEQQLQTDQSQLESAGLKTEDNENDKRLQTETRQLQLNEKQLQKETTNAETRRTQTGEQQPENQSMQRQREHRQTQTDESENKNYEQPLHKRMETIGTQTTSPDFQSKKQASPQTESTPADVEVALSEQDHQQRMERSDVQSDSRDCPADHQPHYTRHDNVVTAQYTCSDEITTGHTTQEDSSETFRKYICEPQQGQRNPPHDNITPSGVILQQQLLCLTVEQLQEVATHLGIGRQTLDQLKIGCTDAGDMKRHLIEKCMAASDTETLCMAVLRLCSRPAVRGATENDIGIHRNSQTAPTSTSETGPHLSAAIFMSNCDDFSAHIQCNQSAAGDQLLSSFSTETQWTALESFAQSDSETSFLVPPLPCNPQALNSVDQVDLLHFTQADPCLFSGMSTTSDLQGSESSTSSGHYTPVLASMLLSSASSGRLSPGMSQQQVTRPAHATRSAQRRFLVDHPQTSDRGNIVTSDWHSRIQVDPTNRPGNEASMHAPQPPVIDIESLVQINQRLQQHTVDIHSRVRVDPTNPPGEDVSLHAAQPPVIDRDSWVHINQRLQQLEDTMTRQSQDPQPPVLCNERQAGPETQLRQRLLEMEIQMQDRLEHLIQHRLQSAGTAESRVYLNQMRALQIDMYAHIESQFSHLRTQMHGAITQAMNDFRREMNMNVHEVIVVHNASSSSSHSAPLSEVPD